MTFALSHSLLQPARSLWRSFLLELVDCTRSSRWTPFMVFRASARFHQTNKQVVNQRLSLMPVARDPYPLVSHELSAMHPNVIK